jgi:hypothetical protein
MARVLALLLLTGCSSLTLTLVRPSQVNTQSYSLGRWTAAKPGWQDALDDLLGSLRKEIAAAPDGPAFHEPGAVVLEGTLTAYGFEEHEERQETTCLNAQNVESPCVALLSHGVAHLELTMRALDGAGKLLNSTSVPLDLRVQAGPLVSQDATVLAAHPVKVDSVAALAALRAQAASQLAAVVAPHAVSVSRMIPACDDGLQNCQSALFALQRCDFAKARTLFAAAAGVLQKDPKKKPDAAGALWGEALAAEFGGDAPGALALLRQASALAPQSEFTDEPTNVRVEEAYAQQAAAMGLKVRCIPQALP